MEFGGLALVLLFGGSALPSAVGDCAVGENPNFHSVGNKYIRDRDAYGSTWLPTPRMGSPAYHNDAKCCFQKAPSNLYWGALYTNSEPPQARMDGSYTQWARPQDPVSRWRFLKPATLAQEGRSFCLVGEHIKESQLAQVEVLTDFQSLVDANLDIGNHILPEQSTKMNTYTPSKVSPSSKGDELGMEAACEGKNDAGNRPAALKADAPSPNCKNPYRVEVTEISAHMTRLHNYLHIKVVADGINTQPIGAKNCPEGKIKYLMLEVRDAVGFPVGHFTNDVPCDSDTDDSSVGRGPNGIEGKRYIGAKKNAIPCMYAPKQAVSHPGIFLAASGSDDYFTEVHATWRFAQHSSNFISELHFAALIVEDPKPIRYVTGRVTKWLANFCWYKREGLYEDAHHCWEIPQDFHTCHISDETNTRPYGYIAKYQKLQLTTETVGGWDHYRKNFVLPEQVNCHAPVSPKYYVKDQELSVLTVWDLFNVEANTQLYNDVYLRKDVTFIHDTSVQALEGYGRANRRNTYETNQGVFKTPKEWVIKYASKDPMKIQTKFALAPGKKGKSYLGTKHTKDYYKSSELAYVNSMSKETLDWQNSLIPMNLQAKSERCACPLLPTTLPPEFQTKPPLELEGRRLHAIQMLIAWVLLLPIALFSARYFKETYSRVFFMREFWWYTIHVICLFTALLFMVGGIYVIRLNRVADAPWINETWLHAIFGYILMFVFIVHLFMGPFRLWDPYQRVMQIMVHWMVGVLEYLMGAVTILIAGALPQGFLSCQTFQLYLGFLFVQILFYVVMEIQMHWVDRLIHLKPKRLYLPPPVMRLFHEDAPYSKFRITGLILFVVTCFLFYGGMHLSINETATSCFEVQYQNDDEILA